MYLVFVFSEKIDKHGLPENILIYFYIAKVYFFQFVLFYLFIYLFFFFLLFFRIKGKCRLHIYQRQKLFKFTEWEQQ